LESAPAVNKILGSLQVGGSLDQSPLLLCEFRKSVTGFLDKVLRVMSEVCCGESISRISTRS
jgi:hypothetical protein